jgi:hypothetical protein
MIADRLRAAPQSLRDIVHLAGIFCGSRAFGLWAYLVEDMPSTPLLPGSALSPTYAASRRAP